MDDDGADWLSAADEPEPEPVAASPAASVAAPAADAAPSGDAPAEDPVAKGVEPVEAADEYLDPDKLLLFKHWIRPKFLPYKYLTDYRRNYYDDVIDFLDKRNRGITRDIPVAQTWAERVLRSCTKDTLQAFRLKLQDKRLVEETKFSGKFQLHHGKNYICKRYYSILY
ncbi:flightin isoform X2 [Euwallacea fornicatus]|uniref:flightin isoform X2 n=1 Tax=Euwallacea fornicatus TaxID=995702 RepID=UPI00338F4C2F